VLEGNGSLRLTCWRLETLSVESWRWKRVYAAN
jgi:hypothetical protein